MVSLQQDRLRFHPVKVPGALYFFSNRELGRRIALMNRDGFLNILLGMIACLEKDIVDDFKKHRPRLVRYSESAHFYLCRSFQAAERLSLFDEKGESRLPFGVVMIDRLGHPLSFGWDIFEMRYDQIIDVLEGILEKFRHGDLSQGKNTNIIETHAMSGLYLEVAIVYLKKMLEVSLPHMRHEFTPTLGERARVFVAQFFSRRSCTDNATV